MFAESREETAPAAVDMGGRPSVLVVEDHPTTLKLMSAWLEMSGYHVYQAADGSEAWAAAQENCPSIVVTDWNMPRMSGLELCRCIRSKHPCHQVYVLVATSRDERDDVMAAMDAGANDFLAKPINEDEFLARIRNAEYALKRLKSQAALAETDSLTGLLNRRFFDEQCQREIERARDYSLPLSCIALDIDLFKHVNDEHGHSAGDMVLINVADVIRRESRKNDLACRLGGDEFCLLLPRAKEEEAVHVAERIRQQVGQLRIATDDQFVGATVTLGVARRTDEVGDTTDLLDLADKVLLAAKSAGRNRVMSLTDLENRTGSALDNTPRPLELGDTTAREIMTGSIYSLNADQSLREALDLFLQESIDCAPVIDRQSKLVGMVSERDLLTALSTADQWNSRVRDVMTSNVARFEEDTPAAQIWDCLQRSPMLRVVIVNNDSPVGFVGRRALLRLFFDGERDSEADQVSAS